jgi:hypothetical protein
VSRDLCADSVQIGACLMHEIAAPNSNGAGTENELDSSTAQMSSVAEVSGASPSGFGAVGPDEPDSSPAPRQPGEDTST